MLGWTKDSALLQSRDAGLLEPPERPQGSPASSSVWREDPGLLSRPCRKRRYGVAQSQTRLKRLSSSSSSLLMQEKEEPEVTAAYHRFPVLNAPTLIHVCVLSLFSCVQLFVTLWTVARQVCCPWISPGKNTGMGCHVPNPGIKPASLYVSCISRWVLYHQHHLGSPFNTKQLLCIRHWLRTSLQLNW